MSVCLSVCGGLVARATVLLGAQWFTESHKGEQPHLTSTHTSGSKHSAPDLFVQKHDLPVGLSTVLDKPIAKVT